MNSKPVNVNELLKPKSEEEIKDLEKRGFRKNSGHWKFCLDICSILLDYEKNTDLDAFKVSIIAFLKDHVRDIRLYAIEQEFHEFEKIVKSFEGLCKENVDNLMEELYDWADKNNVWIESTEFVSVMAPRTMPT